jgi:hypothetical protein
MHMLYVYSLYYWFQIHIGCFVRLTTLYQLQRSSVKMIHENDYNLYGLMERSKRTVVAYFDYCPNIRQ